MKEGKEASIVFFIMLVGVKLELKALFICLLLCKYITQSKELQTLFTLCLCNSLIPTLIFIHLKGEGFSQNSSKSRISKISGGVVNTINKSRPVEIIKCNLTHT